MIYNNKYSFTLNHEDKSYRIDVPRTMPDKSDFTTLELKKLIMENLKIQKDIKLLLNNIIIPCNQDFSISLLPYLPYQYIKVQVINPNSDLNISKNLDSVKVEFNRDEFQLFNDILLTQNPPNLNFHKSEFSNSKVSISDIKNHFVSDMKNYSKDPINPYELIFCANQRYLSDDEDAFTQSPLIVTRRKNKDAVYPLIFLISYNQKITKWYHKSATFGQIAFDLFGEDYYKYKFILRSENNNQSNMNIDFSSKVKKIVCVDVSNFQFEIKNQFVVKENDIFFYTFNINNFDVRNIQYFFLNSNDQNQKDLLYFYKTQQAITNHISTKFNYQNYFLVEKYNYKAKITDYGNMSKTEMLFIRPDPKNLYIIYFYNYKRTKTVYLKDFSTVFNLRYLISSYEKFKIEDVIILDYEKKDFKPLNDQIILKNSSPTLIKYVVYYIINNDNSSAVFNYSDNISLNPNENFDHKKEKEKPIDVYLSSLFTGDENKSSDPTKVEESLIGSFSRLEPDKKGDIHHTIPESSLSNPSPHDSEGDSAIVMFPIPQSGEEAKSFPTENNKNDDSSNKPSQKKKIRISKFKPNTTKVYDTKEGNNEGNNREETNHKGNDEESNKEKSKHKENEEEEKKESQIKNDLNISGVITELDYLKLTFLYNGKELVFYQPKNNENLNILESKICRFYDLNCKIDFYLENDPAKKSIKDVPFDTMKKKQRIMVLRTNDPIEKTIYYKIYGENDEYHIDDVKTVGELKRKIIKLHKRFKLNNINIIFGGKFLDDKVSLSRLSSPIDNEKNKIVLTIYQNKSIIDFSTTIVLKND